MIEFIHKHITEELQQNTKTDTIFIMTAIALNLILLAVNSGLAGGPEKDTSVFIVMILFVTLLILLNIVVIFGLQKSKQTRTKLLNGLIQMYEDKGVDKYYDSSLLSNYNTRYNLFMMVVVLTGLVAIIVPFVVI